METSETQTPIAPEPIAAAHPTPTAPSYDQCGQCGAAVEANQRYCVVCGFHRRHVRDPAAGYLMKATSQNRSRSASAGRRRRSSSVGVALLMAFVPIAVGVGVLVGQSSSGADDKLIAALRAQKPEVITTAGGGGGAAAGSGTFASSTSVSSTYPLQSGYAVEIQTLPAHGTTRSTVTSAEQAAKSNGAPKVGLILQSDFRVTPAPPSGAFVIYSGAYKSSAEAKAALAKLAKSFHGAKVIHVQSAAESTAGGGKVLAHTQYGTVHQIVGFKVNKTQLAQGAAAVKKIQQNQGKSYVDQQRGLPDQISVP
ncbi:hypothetical protein AYO39_02695 [Actinobacteria bacterium SCGC AG-212-D09]|nr:hypothetical protein AYO39_02695 [Actinobacteria bacterium SCGC AG-212-D09]